MEERRSLVRRQADRELAEKRDSGAEKQAARRRRRAIRHNCAVNIKAVFVHSAGSSEEWTKDLIDVRGRVLDISTGGVSLFTKHPFDMGQELRLAITLKDGAAVNAAAVVRWVKALPEKKGSAAGVQFSEVSEKDRRLIAGFLESLDETAGL